MSKLKSLWSLIKTQLSSLWEGSKGLILAIGGVMVLFMFQKIKEWWLVYSGKKEIQTSQKQDQALANTENTDSAKADALQQKAQQLPSTEAPVQPDWYKDQK